MYLQNREIIRHILEAFKSNEKLWNPAHPLHKYNATREVYEELSEPLFKDRNLVLSGSEIFDILKDLRSKYRRELTKCRLVPTYTPKLWCFEQMSFLRDIIENKRAKRTSKVDHQEQSLVESSGSEMISLPNHSRVVLCHLLEAFKSQPSLWNPEHADYLGCNKNQIYESIAAQLTQDHNVSLTGRACYMEVQKLCTRYRKELRLLRKRKGLHIPKLWCFNQLEFLQNIYEQQIAKRLDKRKGVIESTTTKNTFLRSEGISFQNSEVQLRFIELYRNQPTLWNVDHPDYRSSMYRNRALNQLLEQLNEILERNFTLDELQKTIHQLRKDYSTAKQKQLNDKPTILKPEVDFLEAHVGPFRCVDCGVLVKTADQYKIHRSRHDGTQPFTCTLCGKGFQMPGNLGVHLRRHKRDFPYSCEVCKKSFATSTEVSIHMRTHTGERPYVCDLCSKSFKTWSFFDIHRRTHLQQSTFHCPICDKGFYEKNRYTDHMNGHLNIRKHQCNDCAKSFTTFANLKKHRELHLPVKKYKCPTCSKRFAQLASLRWHKIKKHTHAQYEEDAPMEP